MAMPCKAHLLTDYPSQHVRHLSYPAVPRHRGALSLQYQHSTNKVLIASSFLQDGACARENATASQPLDGSR